MKISILFGIVCYREKFWETQSFKDIVMSHKKSSLDNQLLLSIYDNTDFKEWNVLQDCPSYDNVIINYKHDSSNSGIAIAFNYFAEFSKNKNLQWIVFLDQDTSLPSDFFNKYVKKTLNTDKNILFPKIYIGKHLFSPSHYNWFRTSEIKEIQSDIMLHNITAINSGMMIKTDFYLQNGGYNKNLRIDFCDHEFIERINNRQIFADIIDVCLHQEFSSKTNKKKKSLERYKLYCNDLKVYRKNKNKLLFFLAVDLPHLLKEIYRNRSLKFFKIRFK
ncbi:MAG: glycosyl transferase, group 2 family protein [Chryseobacterium sp.]|uniref:glycosyltransferase n=1 Tax=Chryseobacterium sp. TaxID=1871047 RepID=UPI0026076773|nr:glycosyltransferase [Chryseobacterium sp.]MDF2553890.1 glycosyl transferase, group 2 family protein [Chryseobacterium sp.]MDF2932664.1 glycosyl transferase, group 2 family protein [Chryseobacterium sp.]